MRTAPVLVLLALAAPAFASQPGQPLDCSDWVFLEPGVSCGVHMPCSDAGSLCGSGSGNRRVVDAQGRTLQVRRVFVDSLPSCGTGYLGRTEIVRWDGGTAFVVAYANDRCEDSAWGDKCIRCFRDLFNADSCYAGTEPNQLGDINFDLVNGRLLIGLSSIIYGRDCGGGPAYIFAFSGFTTLFDLLESFQPDSTVGQVVPVRPEGFRAADRFDTYWGNVTKPLDLSQAHPLQCAYPDHQPAAGEYLTYPDAAPTPAPGHALYYLTSVSYQGQTRAGRKAIDGRLSGRDASQLPACVIQKEVKR